MNHSPPIPRRRRPANGFSLVELMVASVLLVLSLTGTSVLFIESNRSSAAATLRYRQQALVDADLARVRRLNDRYTCSSGICTSLGTKELGKNDFFPEPTSTAADGNSAAGHSFEALCKSTGLITQLVADIGPTPSGLTAAGITYDPIDTTNQGGVHRYTITYTNSTSNEELRRVTLVPTTVAWCP
ncbi:type IV pilus modification PilV family protein [Synechococcus sp. BA-132 BA5]|uniref:type IV pilus modification PilV family protein n=1 Tax=Synechococcus sp. BA-132 BA5 TaxID=3110252 RepID=UPI002B1F398A|nr:prepilin-type N-terminal cleavage/methylation domain-containing protein [Synechococcus sp. BA-132 BA5]MEA5414893.1 prepilin-type N-terminal cleavage/methylation domain-containing protein [Synechococcus sp. BA-132 BA5]